MDDDTEHKKAKGIKKCIIKRELTLKNYEDCLFNDTIILKSQQRFKSDCHNVYTEQTNKIALSSKDDKRLQTYPYGTNTFKVYESEMSTKMQMINFDDHANENKTQHNLKWPHIPDHSYRILITGGSRSGGKNALLNVINNQPAIDKIYFYAKYTHEAKYLFLINKRESMGLNHFNDPKAFIEHSNDMHDVYKNIDEYNVEERKILIVFDDMIADMTNTKKLNSIVTNLFIRGRKLNISLVFIPHLY